VGDGLFAGLVVRPDRPVLLPDDRGDRELDLLAELQALEVVEVPFEHEVDFDAASERELELVGFKLKQKRPEIFGLFIEEFAPISIMQIASTLNDCFPKLYVKLEKETEADLQAWIKKECEYRKSNSFVDEPGNYLRREL